MGLYLNPPDRALVLCVDEKPHHRQFTPEPSSRTVTNGPAAPMPRAAPLCGHHPTSLPELTL